MAVLMWRTETAAPNVYISPSPIENPSFVTDAPVVMSKITN